MVLVLYINNNSCLGRKSSLFGVTRFYGNLRTEADFTCSKSQLIVERYFLSHYMRNASNETGNYVQETYIIFASVRNTKLKILFKKTIILKFKRRIYVPCSVKKSPLTFCHFDFTEYFQLGDSLPKLWY